MCNNEIPGLKVEKSELKKGIVKTNLFQKICTTQEKKEELIRTYLRNFELAVELKNGQLFIPSIVSDRDEVKSSHNVIFIKYIYLFSDQKLQDIWYLNWGSCEFSQTNICGELWKGAGHIETRRKGYIS